ncbi:MAG: hypothetical protein V4640_13645 [Verrucomicrobiota bacterium]
MSRGFATFCLASLLLLSCEKKPQDSSSADTHAAANPPVKQRLSATERSSVTRSGLRQSLDQATGMQASPTRDHALESLAEDAMELDAELALEAFDQLTPDGPVRTRLVGHLAMRLAEKDIGNATQWAGSLQDETEKSLAFGNVALVLSAEDPAAAARLLSDSGIPSRDFDVAVVQVIQRWAATSPAEAAAWVQLFDASEARSAGLREIASAWADRDAPAAYAWIFTIQDPSIRAEAIHGMAEAIQERPAEDQRQLLRSAPKEIRLHHEKLTAEAEEN